MSKSRIVLAGAGDLGRELAWWIRGECPNIAFIDDVMVARGVKEVDGIPVIGQIHPDTLAEMDALLVPVSSPESRRMLTNRFLHTKVRMPAFVHDSVVLAGSARIGVGSMVFPQSVVSAKAKVGAGCVVNVLSSVGHDVEMGDYCTVSSHVDICGHVTIGQNVFFGTGARVLPKVSIGHNAFIGAGAVVLRDVGEGETVFGNPARKM